MVDRRDFLKFFGAGATVVPLIGGMPHAGAVARLIEPPRVEQVEPKVELATPGDVEAMKYDTLRACVQITQIKPTQSVFGFAGGEFVIAATANEIDVTLMHINGVDCGGHWSTRNVPPSTRPVDCEFNIRVSYRRMPRKDYPMARRDDAFNSQRASMSVLERMRREIE